MILVRINNILILVRITQTFETTQTLHTLVGVGVTKLQVTSRRCSDSGHDTRWKVKGSALYYIKVHRGDAASEWHYT